MVVVTTKAELVAALSSAVPGSAVFVDGSAKIDLTGAGGISVPATVTLASDRGVNGNPGGLLYSTEAMPNGMIAIHEGSRVTGIRIRGHDSTNCDTCGNSRGIVSGSPYIEIDNSLIEHWTYAGISLSGGAIGAGIHHNYIRLNRKQEAGYGLVLDSSPASAGLEWNRFNNNRHAVAGNGAPEQSYEARYNLVLPQSFGHVFDMHGDASGNAGTTIMIHNNFILHEEFSSVRVRGIPTHYSWTYSNCIARAKLVSSAAANKKDAIAQHINGVSYPAGYQNFSVGSTPTWASAPNRFSQTAASCGVSDDL